MINKILSSAVIATMVASAAVPTAALARDRSHHGWQKQHKSYDRGYDRGYRDANHRRNNNRNYYGNRYCKQDKGTGGLVIGALAGGLLGNQIASDKTLGTILGGGVGALAGRAIDKSDSRC